MNPQPERMTAYDRVLRDFKREFAKALVDEADTLPDDIETPQPIGEES